MVKLIQKLMHLKHSCDQPFLGFCKAVKHSLLHLQKDLVEWWSQTLCSLERVFQKVSTQPWPKTRTSATCWSWLVHLLKLGLSHLFPVSITTVSYTHVMYLLHIAAFWAATILHGIKASAAQLLVWESSIVALSWVWPCHSLLHTS